MDNWTLIAIIAGSVMVPAVVISLVVFVSRYYCDKALIFSNDASGHFLPVKSFRLKRKKVDEVWNLCFFNKFFYNWKVLDKGYLPLTESNNSRLYLLYRDFKGFLHDFRLDADSVKEVYGLKCIPTDVFSTQMAILHNLNATYNPTSWFQKWGPWVVGGSLGVLLVFAILYQGHVTGQMADKAASVTDRCFQGCVHLWNASQQNLTALKVV